VYLRGEIVSDNIHKYVKTRTGSQYTDAYSKMTDAAAITKIDAMQVDLN
jgi:hypothetical protein